MQNNKRYWFRGGVLISVLSLIVASISWMIHYFDPQYFFIFFSPGFFIALFIHGMSIFDVDLIVGIEAVFISIIIYFMIGSSFGWIYGKIQNKNR